MNATGRHPAWHVSLNPLEGCQLIKSLGDPL
jgi:hypothetical protein